MTAYFRTRATHASMSAVFRACFKHVVMSPCGFQPALRASKSELELGLKGLSASPRIAGEVPLFTHIPKNGGTFVEAQLTLHGLSSFKPEGCRIPCSPQHVPVGLAIEDGCHKREEGREMFAVLRHPYQRAISQWTWGKTWISKRFDYNWTAAGMNRFIQDSVRNASLKEGSAACRAPEEGRETSCGRFLQDCHWLPQSAYIYSSDYSQSLVTVLLHQSNLTKEVGELLGGIIDRPPPGWQQSRVDMRAAMELEDMVSEKDFASWACSLTEKTKLALDRHYAKDFELFGHLFDKTNFVKKPCKPSASFDKIG